MTIEELYEMELHDVVGVDGGDDWSLEVTRVPGGLLYTMREWPDNNVMTTTFVPLANGDANTTKIALRKMRRARKERDEVKEQRDELLSALKTADDILFGIEGLNVETADDIDQKSAWTMRCEVPKRAKEIIDNAIAKAEGDHE